MSPLEGALPPLIEKNPASLSAVSPQQWVSVFGAMHKFYLVVFRRQRLFLGTSRLIDTPSAPFLCLSEGQEKTDKEEKRGGRNKWVMSVWDTLPCDTLAVLDAYVPERHGDQTMRTLRRNAPLSSINPSLPCQFLRHTLKHTHTHG